MIRLKHLLTEGENLKSGAIDRGVAVANTLKSKLGLTSFQAAAIAGNFVEESGVRSDARQDMTGRGQYLPGPIKIDGRTGYSFGQWTYQARQESLRDFAKGRGLDIEKEPLTNKIATAFVVHELTSEFPDVLKQLKSTKNITDATNVILKKYEMPANQGASALNARTENARMILNKMAKSGTTTPTKKTDPTFSGTIATSTSGKTSSELDKKLDKLSKLAKAGVKVPGAYKSSSTPSSITSSYHVVKSGDTLSGIASKYKIKIDTIKKLNKLTSDKIKPGQKLKVK